jgi:branched-chain amino acid transport system permease protein
LGSLAGALLASLVIGVLQTLAVGFDVKLGQLLGLPAQNALTQIAVSQLAPLLPFALMVLVLLLRPRGLLGQRA